MRTSIGSEEYAAQKEGGEEGQDAPMVILNRGQKAFKRGHLQGQIRASKYFFEDLYRDPWGHPCSTVRAKLHQQALPTEFYEPELLSQIVAGLFLADVPETPPLVALVPEPEPEGRPGSRR